MWEEIWPETGQRGLGAHDATFRLPDPQAHQGDSGARGGHGPGYREHTQASQSALWKKRGGGVVRRTAFNKRSTQKRFRSLMSKVEQTKLEDSIFLANDLMLAARERRCVS
jgi:hypothetical protein